MAALMLNELIETFRSGRDFDGSDAEAVLDALIGESDESLLAELFRAWDAKGIASHEIYGLAKIMRGRCIKIKSDHDRFIDIVGTGGSGSKTFNVSTAAAFVVAGTGVAVAKHGNKAATSSTGSADVLSALGVEPAVDAATAERCLNEIGICFMFAPNFHRLSPTLGKVRRGLGFPTVFNCVGPLCNPASAPHQLIGVWHPAMVASISGALSELGTKLSWVVHAEDGLDEISLAGKTSVAEVTDEPVAIFEVRPEDYKLAARPHEACRVNSAEESSALIKRILENKEKETAAEQLVLINAATALVIVGAASLPAEGVEIATESIRNGNALTKLTQLAEAVRV
jgi:anthranilate phosphoribosyltransferase